LAAILDGIAGDESFEPVPGIDELLAGVGKGLEIAAKIVVDPGAEGSPISISGCSSACRPERPPR